jgi:hypothetical protein
MRYTGKNSLATFIKILILLSGILGIIIMVSLPWTLSWLMKIFYEGSVSNLYTFFIIILYVLGLSTLAILNELRIIFNSLEKTDPFTYRNVAALKRITVLCVVNCVVFLVKVFVANSLMTMVALFVFFVAMLFSLILSEVFKKAVEYKEDNDLTI